MWRFARNPAAWLGLIVSIGALALAFRGLHWRDVGQALADANYGLIALALLIMLVIIAMRTVRWAVLFYPRQGLRMGSLFGALNVGYALNNLLPVRLGELGRAYVIRQSERVSAAHALSTIVVERTLDTLTVVAFLLVTLPFIDAPGWATGPALFLGLGFLVLALLLALISAARERALGLVSWGVRFLPARFRTPVEQAADAAIEGFATLRRPWVLTQAVWWSALSWGLSAVFVYVVLRAFALDVSFTAGVFVMAATSLGMVVPSSPGYIGVYHAIAIESLVGVFDSPREASASFALASHALLYLTPIVLAAGYFWLERSTWRELRVRLLERPEAAPEALGPIDTAEAAER